MTLNEQRFHSTHIEMIVVKIKINFGPYVQLFIERTFIETKFYYWRYQGHVSLVMIGSVYTPIPTFFIYHDVASFIRHHFALVLVCWNFVFGCEI